MTKEYVIALDNGTTSTRAIVYDRNVRAVACAQTPLGSAFPQPGWVEQSPTEIFDTAVQAIRGAMANAGIGPQNVAAVGIANQRETAVVWDKRTGEPIGPAIVWQCRRTAPRMEELKRAGLADKIRRKTGLPLDAYFSASKFERIIADAGAQKRLGELAAGTVDSFLLYKLTGGRAHMTDYTNASRTMLFDIRKLRWDDELIRLFGLSEKMLPEVRPSGGDFGFTDPELFGAPMKIAAMAGDQQAALYGQGCVNAGEVKNTYGTGCFLLMNTGGVPLESRAGLITTIAAGSKAQPDYALEGSSFVGGAAVQWLRDGLGLVGSAAETERIAREAESSGGVYLVPAFVGLGAPYWAPDARGLISGITRGTRREHIVRATLESIAYGTADLIRAMEKDSGASVSALKADGGAAANGFLMQFQSDILGADVLVPADAETTAKGAALLAARATGFAGDNADNQAEYKLFRPTMSREERESLYDGWLKAVSRALV